jgi:hypothetical protein
MLGTPESAAAIGIIQQRHAGSRDISMRIGSDDMLLSNDRQSFSPDCRRHECPSLRQRFQDLPSRRKSVG